MIRRLLVCVVALPLLLLAVASCRTDPSVAAYIGDNQVPLERVEELYQRAADDPVSRDIVDTYPTEARLEMVQTLVRVELLRAAAERENITVTDSDIARIRKVAQERREGLQPSLRLLPVDLLAEREAYAAGLERWATTGVSSTQEAQVRLTDTLRETLEANPVRLNPRFGRFDANTFQVLEAADNAVVGQ